MKTNDSNRLGILSLLFAIPSSIIAFASIGLGSYLWYIESKHSITQNNVISILTPYGYSIFDYLIVGLFTIGTIFIMCDCIILYGFFSKSNKPRVTKMRRFSFTLVICAICAIFLTSGFLVPVANATISTTNSSVISQFSCEKDATMLFTVDNAATPNYYGIQASSTTSVPCGTLEYESTTLSTVLNSGITGNEKVLFASGTFTLSAAVNYDTPQLITNIIMEGQGSSSNITTTANFNSVSGCCLFNIGSNWIVQDMGFYGGHMTYGNSHGTLGVLGNNDTVEFNTFYKGDHGQIVVGAGSIGNRILSNSVLNSNDDGIISYGTRNTIEFNYIYKTTNHNCISLIATSYDKVIGNTCSYSSSNGIALENLGAGVNTGTIINQNTITSPANAGIIIYPQSAGVDSAQNVTINTNTINKAGNGGIFLESGKQITACLNIIYEATGYGIDSSTGVSSDYSDWNFCNNQIISPSLNGIGILSVSTSTQIIGNTFAGIVSGQYAIAMIGATNCIISNNNETPKTTGDYGIEFITTASSGCTISGNQLTGTSAAGFAINFAIATTYSTISNNVFDLFSKGYDESSGVSNFNVITGNVFESTTTPVTFSGANDMVCGNIGYNPVAPTATITAGASVWTFTNGTGCDVVMQLKAVNGISAETCNGESSYPITIGTNCIIPVAGTMTVTWTVTAPTYTEVPLTF